MTLQPSQVENQETSQSAPVKDNSTETNLRKIARSLEEERTRSSRLEQEVAQLREASIRHRQDEEPDDAEPYVDEKRLTRKLERFAEDMDKKFDKRVEQKAALLIENERQQNFLKSNPDFNQILSDETVLQRFVDKHPEMAEPLLEMPDNFARKKLVYQAIKSLNLHKPDAPKTSIQDRIDANRKSPYYQPSSSGSPPYGNNGDYSAGGQKNAYEKMKSLIAGKRF